PTSRANSPDWRRPSLMLSSQTLCPRSWSWTQGDLLMTAILAGRGGTRLHLLPGREHHAAAFRVARGADAVAPRHVARRSVEHHALGRQRGIGRVDVLDEEIDRRLLRGARLAHAL